MQVIQYSTLRQKTANWYDRPFAINIRIRKSTLIILILLGYIIWSHITHVGAQPIYRSAIIKPTLRARSTDNPRPVVSKLQRGGFSVSEDLFFKTIKSHNDELEAKHLEAIQAAKKAEVEQDTTASPEAATKPVNSPNTYYWGQCVWALKEWKPEIPNTWHSAYLWDNAARADGYTVSSIPKVGAVAQTDNYGWGHVALVLAVYNNGTFLVREMNWKGLGITDERLVDLSDFQRFIYV